jgi:hypothetical protein
VISIVTSIDSVALLYDRFSFSSSAPPLLGSGKRSVISISNVIAIATCHVQVSEIEIVTFLYVSCWTCVFSLCHAVCSFLLSVYSFSSPYPFAFAF